MKKYTVLSSYLAYRRDVVEAESLEEANQVMIERLYGENPDIIIDVIGDAVEGEQFEELEKTFREQVSFDKMMKITTKIERAAAPPAPKNVE